VEGQWPDLKLLSWYLLLILLHFVLSIGVTLPLPFTLIYRIFVTWISLCVTTEAGFEHAMPMGSCGLRMNGKLPGV
jgi:hypothetical protein